MNRVRSVAKSVVRAAMRDSAISYVGGLAPLRETDFTSPWEKVPISLGKNRLKRSSTKSSANFSKKTHVFASLASSPNPQVPVPQALTTSDVPKVGRLFSRLELPISRQYISVHVVS